MLDALTALQAVGMPERPRVTVTLTEQQRAVLILSAAGYSPAQVADAMASAKTQPSITGYGSTGHYRRTRW